MHEPDDLDRLIAEAPPPRPPNDIGARARARLRTLVNVRRLTATALVAVVALIALAVLSYRLGAAVASSDAPALVRLAVEDRSLALEARDELLTALLDAVPWRDVLAAAASALVLVLLAAYMLRATALLDGEPERRR